MIKQRPAVGLKIKLIQADPEHGPFGVWQGTQGKIEKVDDGMALFRVEWDNDTVSIEGYEDQGKVWAFVETE